MNIANLLDNINIILERKKYLNQLFNNEIQITITTETIFEPIEITKIIATAKLNDRFSTWINEITYKQKIIPSNKKYKGLTLYIGDDNTERPYINPDDNEKSIGELNLRKMHYKLDWAK